MIEALPDPIYIYIHIHTYMCICMYTYIEVYYTTIIPTALVVDHQQYAMNVGAWQGKSLQTTND